MKRNLQFAKNVVKHFHFIWLSVSLLNNLKLIFIQNVYPKIILKIKYPHELPRHDTIYERRALILSDSGRRNKSSEASSICKSFKLPITYLKPYFPHKFSARTSDNTREKKEERKAEAIRSLVGSRFLQNVYVFRPHLILCFTIFSQFKADAHSKIRIRKG